MLALKGALLELSISLRRTAAIGLLSVPGTGASGGPAAVKRLLREETNASWFYHAPNDAGLPLTRCPTMQRRATSPLHQQQQPNNSRHRRGEAAGKAMMDEEA